MSRILTALAAAGIGEVKERFGKINFSVLCTGTNDLTVAKARVAAITVALKKTHPSRSTVRLMDEAISLLQLGELDAHLQSAVNCRLSGADTIVEFDLLMVYPKRVIGGRSVFGGNITPTENEKYIFEFAGLANVALTMDVCEVPGGDATTIVKYAPRYCNPNVTTVIDTKSAELIAIRRAAFTGIRLQYDKNAEGGARIIEYTSDNLKTFMDDRKDVCYNNAGSIASGGELLYIADLENVEKVHVTLNTGENIILVIPAHA